MMFRRSPPDPLAEERLLVVEQLLLGLVEISGLLEVLHALGDVLLDAAQAPRVDIAPHIVRLFVLPVHLVQELEGFDVVLGGAKTVEAALGQVEHAPGAAFLVVGHREVVEGLGVPWK